MHTNTSNRNHSSPVVERPWPFLFRSQSGLTTLKITGLNYRHETKLPFPFFVFNAVENKKIHQIFSSSFSGAGKIGVRNTVCD